MLWALCECERDHCECDFPSSNAWWTDDTVDDDKRDFSCWYASEDSGLWRGTECVCQYLISNILPSLISSNFFHALLNGWCFVEKKSILCGLPSGPLIAHEKKIQWDSINCYREYQLIFIIISSGEISHCDAPKILGISNLSVIMFFSYSINPSVVVVMIIKMG